MEPSDLRACLPETGVYVLSDNLTGRFVVGLARNLYDFYRASLSRLRAGIFYNLELQRSFTADPLRLSFHFEVTHSYAQALSVKQAILDIYHAQWPERLLTKGKDARHGRLGLVNSPTHRQAISARLKDHWDDPVKKARTIANLHKSGAYDRQRATKRTEASKKRMQDAQLSRFSRPVIIEGIEYRGAAEAGRALGLNRQRVRERLQSSSPRFSNWIYKETMTEQPRLKANDPIIGVYMVLHPSTDLFYVGVSSSLYNVKSLTFSQLRAGTYRFTALQVMWDKLGQSIVFDYVECQTLEEAYQIKQYMLDLGRLAFPKHILNVSSSATNSNHRSYPDDERSKRSRVQKRRLADDIDYRAAFIAASHTPEAIAKRRAIQQSPEFRKKMSMIRTQRAVLIDGIRHESVQAAAFVYGVSHTTVHNRCSSNTERFAGWSYVSKELQEIES